jgi:hypothetical protein
MKMNMSKKKSETKRQKHTHNPCVKLPFKLKVVSYTNQAIFSYQTIRYGTSHPP